PTYTAASTASPERLLDTGLSVGELDDHRGVVARAGAGPLVAVDLGTGHPRREGSGAEHEVDAHPPVALEALPVVVPVRVDLRPRQVRAHHVDVPGVHDGLEGCTLRGSDVGALRELGDVEDVVVLR